MTDLSLFGLDFWQLAHVMGTVLIAGVVRGFAGFGMSALIVLSLSLTLAPVEVVPAALMLEVLASTHMLPGLWRDAQWRLGAWLFAGSLAGAPIGVWLLVHVPEQTMRAALAVFVLAFSLLLWFGYNLPRRPAPPWGLGVGVFAGIANGAASFGGQPTAVFLLASNIGAAGARATLVALSFFGNAYGAGLAWMSGIVTLDTFGRVGLMVLPMVAGIMVGQRRFVKAPPETYRRVALVLLMVFALAALSRSVFG